MDADADSRSSNVRDQIWTAQTALQTLGHLIDLAETNPPSLSQTSV
jgi:hypothetical protein